MRIGVPTETLPGERRVALVPESVRRLAGAALEVLVQRGAGARANYPDAEYADAGAVLTDDPCAVFATSDIVVKVRRPSMEEAALLSPHHVLVALLQPAPDDALLARLAEHQVTSFGLERVPRITRAQSMDVLSSQSTVAGYKAALLGANLLPRFLPMLTTAAGTIAPARAFVIGAGVAGLQAIATARRLGAVVSAFDIRAAAREQVQSVGATFVADEPPSQDAEDAGGYARAQSDDQQERTLALIGRHVPEQDLVISTAQIPGRRAPVLITEEMVSAMRPGSVIVDLAAENGGNCALTRAGDTVVAHDVTIVGPVNLPATVPYHASRMFSRNVESFVKHLVPDGTLHVDLDDAITSVMCVTHGGKVVAK
ncbi:MAG TPA: Re/Si-specific NAD(P)(+) transhydrogenase subunit alpha [Gemmatimonadaceae bacterium]|nr:Re/Si-specific NAD(P)(+) transhydrogenase subunit alpha [Gemmatimonadaceae bacterium]